MVTVFIIVLVVLPVVLSGGPIRRGLSAMFCGCPARGQQNGITGKTA